MPEPHTIAFIGCTALFEWQAHGYQRHAELSVACGRYLVIPNGGQDAQRNGFFLYAPRIRLESTLLHFDAQPAGQMR